MDSMMGYKMNATCTLVLQPLKLDDAVNYIPARLTACMIPIAATLMGLSGTQAYLMMRRDGRKHDSPNAGLSEAAFAGAMGIQLGGPSYYFWHP